MSSVDTSCALPEAEAAAAESALVEHEKQLTRRVSKLKLSKQAEVESENPPDAKQQQQPPAALESNESASRAPIIVQPKPGPALTPAAKLSTDVPHVKLVPETRIESYDSDDSLSLSLQKKLKRSVALCGDDDTRLNAKSLEKQGSSKTSSQCSSLSRGSSTEFFTDSTGTNLEEFIVSTLHKNQKDRTMLIELEDILTGFVEDASKNVHKFSQMSSYNRMLVHRVAAFFGLDHNVDQSGTAVVVTKNKNSRMPDVRFKDYIVHDNFMEESRKALMRRTDNLSTEEMMRSPDSSADRKAKSLDERDDDAASGRVLRVRRFNQQDSASSVEGGVNLESPLSGCSSEAMHLTGLRPWSSTDSSVEGVGANGYLLQQHRCSQQMMQKAGSFGGVPVLYRNDALKVPPKRSNTDANKDNIGYGLPMVQRQPTIPESGSAPLLGSGQVIFAVGSLDQVPPGAVIINPHSGTPYYNPDGTVYYHNPVMAAAMHPVASPRPVTPTMQALQSSAIDPSMLAAQMHMMRVCSPSGDTPMFMSQPQGAAQPQVMTYVVQQQSPVTDANQACSSHQAFVMPASTFMSPNSIPYQSSMQYFAPAQTAMPGSPQISYHPVYYHQVPVAAMGGGGSQVASSLSGGSIQPAPPSLLISTSLTPSSPASTVDEIGSECYHPTTTAESSSFSDDKPPGSCVASTPSQSFAYAAKRNDPNFDDSSETLTTTFDAASE